MSAEAGHIPHDAPLAQDVAINIELPSRRGSLDHGHVTFDGFQLEPVDPNAKVHPSHDIFKDKKTGKHYKKVAPSWSIAHAAAKGKGQPTVEGKRAHGTNFSVGHAIGATKNREPTTPTAGAAMSGNDMDRLVEKLRSVGESLHAKGRKVIASPLPTSRLTLCILYQPHAIQCGKRFARPMSVMLNTSSE
jgi:hypothetical protein